MITLATLHTATREQVFQQGKEHLLKQGIKCAKSQGISCSYRFENLSCVGGCFISDEEYDPDFEGKLWPQLVDMDLVPTSRHLKLISDLQEIHDGNSPDKWENLLNELEEKLETYEP